MQVALLIPQLLHAALSRCREQVYCKDATGPVQHVVSRPLWSTVGGLDAVFAAANSGADDIDLQLLRPLALEAAGVRLSGNVICKSVSPAECICMRGRGLIAAY